jgi:hypothetical protein
MTLDEFESEVNELKKKYLTILKKIDQYTLWMTPNDKDWYHSKYLVIEVNFNTQLDKIIFKLNINTNYSFEGDSDFKNDIEFKNRLLKVKYEIDNFNETFQNIEDARKKHKEVGDKYNFLLEKYKETEYQDSSSLNTIQDKLTGIQIPASISTSREHVLKHNFQKIFKDLHFSDEIKASFYNALKTKGFVILAGISGIGKTKIFEKFVNAFPRKLNRINNVFLPIRPDFKDSKSLLGFYNPLSQDYQTTQVLELILDAQTDLKNPYFILFDEMNLARVEYYFADFLSVMESSRDHEGFTTQSIKLHNSDTVRENQDIPKELFLPPNVYFVGSVNIDETTHMFSPKVLDRAFTIEFGVDDFENYISFLSEMNKVKNTQNSNNYSLEEDDDEIRFTTKFMNELKRDFTNNSDYTTIKKDKFFLNMANVYFDRLQDLNDILPNSLKFGYRVFDEIISFVYNSEKSIFRFEDDIEAFDIAIKMKVLPKLHGNKHKIEKVLHEISDFCEANGFKHTQNKISSMKENLKNIGFTSFM